MNRLPWKVITGGKTLLIPKRAGGFGQAEFSWKGWPSMKETFLVEGWADSDLRPCPHSLAVYAIIYFGDRALLKLKKEKTK